MAGDTPVQINWPYTSSLGRIEDKIDALTGAVLTLYRKVLQLMAMVSIEQSDLDGIASTVSEVADALQEIIDNPNPLEPADESALNAAVEKLKGVGPKVTPSPDAPVEPVEPVEPAQPEQPVQPDQPARPTE